MADDDADLPAVADWLAAATHVTALTGAGISTESGIPDYRGPQGVWRRDPDAERRATITAWTSDPEVRRSAWQQRSASDAFDAAPNAGHLALARLEDLGALHSIVTQNVDGLHQRAGSSPDRVIEIHGTMHRVACLHCAWEQPTTATLERVRAGEPDPMCPDCGGLIKAATISFGQALVVPDIERAEREAARSGVFLAIGTSLAVFPVALLPGIALDAGARLVIVNAEPTPYDDRADVVLRGGIGGILPRLADLLASTRA